MHLHITHLVSFITISIKFSQMRKQNLFSSIFKVLLREGCRVRSNYTYRHVPHFLLSSRNLSSLIFFSSLNVRVIISRLMKLRAIESNRKDEERRTEFDCCENTMSIYANTVPPARNAAKRASFSAKSDRIENIVL